MIKAILEGHKVLVCRPEPSASELCKVLESVGAETYSLPCIEVRTLALTPQVKNIIYALDQYEKVVVVSQHAATQLIHYVDELWPQAPADQKWFGIGRKTTQLLAEADLSVSIPDQDYSSEGLLDTPELNHVKGQKILIAKGKEGRSKLEQGLRDRGAKVTTIELYERVTPEYSDQTLQESISDFGATSIVTLSAETLDNLHSLAKSISATPTGTRLIVPSERVAKHAQS
ncbi:hypothetical protein A3742_18490, partial [Oleiphilus sp. HI0071]